MNYIFQFCRILAVCFLGEVLAHALPFPIPASVYGLVLLLTALKAGIFRLEQVRAAGKFLIAIMPMLFIPAAVGVMELWDALGAMLIPCVIATGPITMFVMGVTGIVTQNVQRRIGKKGAKYDSVSR
ncbi:MAG: CidA/LrgA family protein [Oscillibacter sp.]|nr:CidA/LrgA family protein [Oscillibacter sp.]